MCGGNGMDLLEAIYERHSVRSYKDKKIEGEVLNELQHFISQCNEDSGLSIQLCLNEPKAFTGMMAKFMRFNNANNYIALVGKESDDLSEKCGYYGEKIVLKAQQLGLNTCWVAVTFSKSQAQKVIKLNADEKLLIVIAIGYGETNGTSHKVKPIEELSNINELKDVPEWFLNGMKAAQLAPTARNQQKFRFELHKDEVKSYSGSGAYTKVDLGIAKYHFEIGSGKNIFKK
jgi:hypothetical protein